MDNGQFQEFVVKHLTILSEDVKSLKRDFSSMEGEFSSLKKDVSSLQNTVTRIETRMENEIIDKISALFDGYGLHKERLDDHDKKIVDLSRNDTSHEMRLKVLESR